MQLFLGIVYKFLIAQIPKSRMCVSSVSGGPFLSFLSISLLARHRLKSKACLQIRGSGNYRCLLWSHGMWFRSKRARQMGIILFPISYVKSLGTERACCFNFVMFYLRPRRYEGTSNTLSPNSRNDGMNLPCIKFIIIYLILFLI